MKTQLRAHCATDPDLCGSWSKDETEREMMELCQKPEGDDWVWWILDHVFSDFKVGTESLKDVLVWCGRMEISNPDDGSPIVLELD